MTRYGKSVYPHAVRRREKGDAGRVNYLAEAAVAKDFQDPIVGVSDVPPNHITVAP